MMTSDRSGTQAARAVLVLVGFALLGLVAVYQPILGLGLMLILYVALRGEGMVRDGVAALLIGNIVLTYGFANVGLRVGGLPLPLSDLMLVPLVGFVVLRPSGLRPIGVSVALLCIVAGIALLRLIVDFPHYGNLAIRDFTTYPEAFTLLVGFWAFNRYGLDWAISLWKVTFLIVVAYCALYPWAPQLAAAGPVVGLQQPVALLGQYDGSGPAIGAAFLFYLLIAAPPKSYILGSICLACAFFLQLRGLYLAIPFAVFLVYLIAGKVRLRLTSRAISTMVVGFALLMLIAPLGLQGREGRVSFSFVTEQLGTLLGHKGAGSGSYDQRVTWLDSNLQRVTSSPDHLLFGVGLGPDLVGGFQYTAELVRKPHNDWLEIFVRLGLLAFIAWLAFIASLILPIWKVAKRELVRPAEKSFLLWVLGSSVIYLIISATQPLLAFPYGTVPLFLMLGMGLALARDIEQRRGTATADREAAAHELEVSTPVI